MKITKRSDLFREYARVIDMCEGTKVKPEYCVKYGGLVFHSLPSFDSFQNSYQFAIAIVEGKPVFEGDVLYHKDGNKYTVQQIEKHNDGKIAFRTVTHPLVDGDWIENYSWNPPKPDPYAHLKQAQKEGKRILYLSDEYNRWITEEENLGKFNFCHPVEKYKIVDDDIVEYINTSIDRSIIKVTKSCLDGKITAEVVEQ